MWDASGHRVRRRYLVSSLCSRNMSCGYWVMTKGRNKRLGCFVCVMISRGNLGDGHSSYNCARTDL